jgi:pimeloyl-ACP methyl ester carboxylesterase
MRLVYNDRRGRGRRTAAAEPPLTERPRWTIDSGMATAARSESVERLVVAGRNGVEIVADVAGPAEGEPVVLLHGGGQTRHAWGATARVLGSKGWRAVAVDLRGHGESGWDPHGDYRIDAHVDDLRAIGAALGRPFVAVGASLGGITALVAAGESAAELFRGLVLVDIAPRTEEDGVERVVSFMSAHLEHGFERIEDAAEAVAGYLPHRPRPSNLEGLRKNLRVGDDGRYRWHWDPAMMTGPWGMDGRRNPERRERAARGLRVPTLLVRGRMSDVLSEEGARHFLELAPHARLVDVSGAGHMVAGDVNDAFTEAVVEFLESLPRG